MRTGQMCSFFLAAALCISAALAWFDKPVAEYFYAVIHQERTAWIVDVAKAVAFFGDGTVQSVFLLLWLVAPPLYARIRYNSSFRIARTAPAVSALGAFLATSLLVRMIKIVTSRTRPSEWAEKAAYGFNWSFDTSLNSFPSGHAATIAAIMFCMGKPYAHLRPLCYSLVGLVAIARVVSCKHFLSDVMAGLYIGMIVAAGIWQWTHRVRDQPAFSKQ